MDVVVARLAAAGATNLRLFGSVASGLDTPLSDVDLLYDPGSETTAFAISAARLDIEKILGFSVDLVSARAVPPRKQGIISQAVPL
jgi:predicted nucleotidyltransferase